MYCDTDEFTELYPEHGLSETELETLLETASDEIDSLTFNRIQHKGFYNLTMFQMAKVKKATMLHANFLREYGDVLNSPFSQYSINGVSMSFNGLNIAEINGVRATKQVVNLLKQTGLTRLNLDSWR